MEVFLGWIVFSGVAAWIASSKGRSGVGVFLLSLALSPLVGIIVALVMKSKREQLQEQYQEVPSPETHVRCPDCKELVRKDATVCKHCRAKLVPQAEECRDETPTQTDTWTQPCPKCRTPLKAWAKKCEQCGYLYSPETDKGTASS